MRSDPKPKTGIWAIFTPERVGWAVGYLVTMLMTAWLATTQGCPGPAPKPPTPTPPPPVVVVPNPPVIVPVPEPTLPKKMVIVHESRDDDFEMSQLVIALRKPETKAHFTEHGCSVQLIDKGLKKWDGSPAEVLTKFSADIEKIPTPALFLLDDAGSKVLHSESLKNKATEKLYTLDELFVKLDLHASNEATFASSPFVDTVFSDCPEFVKGDTTVEDTFESVGPKNDEPSFEDAIEVIPRERWDELIAKVDAAGGGLDLLVGRIYNQGREGSCVSNATCQADEIVENRIWGHVVPKSAISLYKRCGSSPNSGSMVSTNLKELCDRGVLPLKNEINDKLFPGHTMENTGFYTKMPANWEDTAKKFRGLEYYDIRSVDGFYTAILKGYPVVYGRSGHSICGVRLVKKNGQYYVKYANSWGNWGDNGFGYDSESYIRSGARWAFALRSVYDSGLHSGTISVLKPKVEEPADTEPSLTQAL